MRYQCAGDCRSSGRCSRLREGLTPSQTSALQKGVLADPCALSFLYGYFYAYSGSNWRGTSISMCEHTPWRILWTADGSWVVNQAAGTVAKFSDDSGVSRWNGGGAFTMDDDAWYWVQNC